LKTPAKAIGGESPLTRPETEAGATSTTALGDLLVSDPVSLALALPGTIITQQSNFLINPGDPGFGAPLLNGVQTVPFQFDLGSSPSADKRPKMQIYSCGPLWLARDALSPPLRGIV